MEEAENFFGFITATLSSSPLVPSLESLSRSPDVSCSGPFEVHPLISKGSASFPKNYFVNYCISVCDFDFVPYILTTALFGVPFVSYLCRFTTLTTSSFASFIVILLVRIRSAVIVSLILPFDFLKQAGGQ